MPQADEPIPLSIPDNWTPQQADAVFEFLAHLADAVFLAYNRQITEIAYREACQPILPAADDFPF